MNKLECLLLATSLVCISFSASAAQKVVVIPLMSDTSSTPASTVRTLISYNGAYTDSSVTYTHELARTLGSFVKTQDDTDIKVHWRSHAEQIGSAGNFCNYTLRLSGQSGFNGDHSGVVIYSNSDQHNACIDNWDYWTDLPAGNYNVEVWIRGDVENSIKLNGGDFSRLAIVEEFLSEASPIIKTTGESQNDAIDDVRPIVWKQGVKINSDF